MKRPEEPFETSDELTPKNIVVAGLIGLVILICFFGSLVLAGWLAIQAQG
jgi:hypothetical protein